MSSHQFKSSYDTMNLKDHKNTTKRVDNYSDSRRLRDTGNELKQSLIWNVDSSIKRAQYAPINKESVKSSLSGSFVDVLNYSRKR
jgi:hypothetical protein